VEKREWAGGSRRSMSYDRCSRVLWDGGSVGGRVQSELRGEPRLRQDWLCIGGLSQGPAEN